jgi:hypothetical protein
MTQARGAPLGTTFSFTLPISVESASETNITSTAGQGFSRAGRSANVHERAVPASCSVSPQLEVERLYDKSEFR